MTNSAFECLLVIPGLIAALVSAGFLYQWLGGHFDRLQYTAEGRWVDIGAGRKLYLLEKGLTQTLPNREPQQSFLLNL